MPIFNYRAVSTMYCPPLFNEDRPETHIGLITQYPLATIIRNTVDGLEADHIPLMHEAMAGGPGKLIGHVTKANTLWQYAGAEELLVVFQGPATYISPNWYATKKETGKVVPTWNYAVLHVHCTLTAIHDPERILVIISALTNQQESSQENPWRVADAPADFTMQRINSIVGIELTINRTRGKWKVSQNHPAANRASVVQGLLAEGSDISLQMAQLVDSQGAK
jgi:transcriptional regulator